VDVSKLRRVMTIGIGMVDQPGCQDPLKRAGLGTEERLAHYRCIFWVPRRPGTWVRNDTRKSVVPDAWPHELEALRDGAIEEVELEVGFPHDLPEELRDKALVQAWENLAKSRLGYVPGGLVLPELVSEVVAEKDFKRRTLEVP